MLVRAGDPPRCWLTGYKFTNDAIDRFLGDSSVVPSPLTFVDIYKRQGLVSRDLQIEIDHLHPFSLGGGDEDNLKIVCGWANSNKGAKVSLYGASGLAVQAKIGGRSLFLPQPYWVIRLIGSVRKCEHEEGCENDIGSVELTVAPSLKSGIPNPIGLRVCCPSHDTLGSRRLASRKSLEIKKA